MRVLFSPDRGWGRGLRGKRSRKYERAGFRRCRLVDLARNPSEADLIYIRNIPEHTTSDNLRQLEALLHRWPEKRVVNHPRSLWLHDSKDRCFAAWRDAGLETPQYVECGTFEQLERFAADFPAVMVRVNNEACGDGTTLLERAGKSELEEAYRLAGRRVEDIRVAGREDSRPMAVEFLDSRGSDGYNRVFRAFVVADTVYGGYALISTEAVVNFGTAACGTADEVELFLQANSQLDEMFGDAAVCDSMRRATEVLALDIAAIDFMVVAGEVLLLEANALWSPSYRWAGGRRGRRAYRSDRDRWHARAANYCRWMDRIGFYEGMYSLFDRF